MHQPKLGEYNNKAEDDNLNALNDKSTFIYKFGDHKYQVKDTRRLSVSLLNNYKAKRFQCTATLGMMRRVL